VWIDTQINNKEKIKEKSEENIQRYKPDPYEYILNDM